LAAGAPRTSRICSSSAYAGSRLKAHEVPADWLEQLVVVAEKVWGEEADAEAAAAEAVRARARARCKQLLMTE
jgi:hypothetical protein